MAGTAVIHRGQTVAEIRPHIGLCNSLNASIVNRSTGAVELEFRSRPMCCGPVRNCQNIFGELRLPQSDQVVGIVAVRKAICCPCSTSDGFAVNWVATWPSTATIQARLGIVAVVFWLQAMTERN